MSGSIAICLTTLFSLTSAVSATKKDVLKITENLSRDGLFAELKKRKTGWNFCIGYGFGAGIAQARLNALNACHEAELKKNTSYVVTEKEELIGPLGAEATETFMVDISLTGILSQNYHRSRSAKLCLPWRHLQKKRLQHRNLRSG